MENNLTNILDDQKTSRKSLNNCNDFCYPDQQIQILQEKSSPTKMDPYLKILEEPGDTRFRYFRLKNYLLSMVWMLFLLHFD